MEKLIDSLKKIDSLPMHMPGHKRNTSVAPYLKKLAANLDITEISGFDNLHNAQGILKQSMESAAALRGAKRAFYLVNGSTCGILAAVCALVSDGDKVICARNCHKSVYNALELSGADAVYVMPEKESLTAGYGSISPSEIEKALVKNSDVRLIIITSPTYEGIVSDVKTICNIAHKYNVPVLVDAAHGAHFGLGYGFPESAIQCGADIAVESLHKTLPSLTQTAVCYVNGNLADSGRIAERLAVFETSSPSYLLLASIDGCINLLENNADTLFKNWETCLDYFYGRADKLRYLSVFTNKDKKMFDFDRSKIVITGADGTQISDLLRVNGIECEMSSVNHAVAMTGMGDTLDSMKLLADALTNIDFMITPKKSVELYPALPKRRLLPKQAKKLPACAVDYDKSEGRISAEYIFAYPPGIPIVTPGEVISANTVRTFANYGKAQIELNGSANSGSGKILVVKS